jgi:hypothetical protein
VEPDIKDTNAEETEFLRGIFGSELDLDDMDEEEISTLRRLILAQSQVAT